MALPARRAALPWGLAAAGFAVGVLAALAGPTATPLDAGLAGLAIACMLGWAGLRRRGAGRYAVFALRLALALALLVGGAQLLQSTVVLAQALGAVWLAGGLGVALGFLTGWSALYAAFAFLLLLPLGFLEPAGLALAALGLALLDDPRLSLDAALARRGGLFPTLRREVVLERMR